MVHASPADSSAPCVQCVTERLVPNVVCYGTEKGANVRAASSRHVYDYFICLSFQAISQFLETMSMMKNAPGLKSMVKEGSRHFSGIEEVVFRNIEACGELGQTLSSAFGPNGLNKMVINHLEKLLVTNDAACILGQLEIQHPAAKMLMMASQMQESEVGDGTNLVLMLASALLNGAEELLRMGIKPVEVAEGYELALKKALSILPELTVYEVKDYKNEVDVKKAIRAALMSKQLGHEDFLAELVTKACISILPEETTFNVDNVRVCKILGSGVTQSSVIQGMVFKRAVEGDVTKQSFAKVVVYTCAFDSMQTETKGTVLIKTAEELQEFSKGEENLLEAQVKAIADTGCKVVVSGGKVGELALHYLNKYGLMVVRLPSKFDVRRVCKIVNATPLPKMCTPTQEDLGLCDLVYVDEIGDTTVVIFRQEAQESRISTVIIRGSTDNYMDDLERAVDDGVNNFKALLRDGRLVAGAGAFEAELARRVQAYGGTLPGMEQYAVKAFADALECVPKALCENSGVKHMDVLTKMQASHHEGKTYIGFDIDGDNDKGYTIDAVQEQIFDLLLTKQWALRYAVDAAVTVLKVDQMIMAKQAGGPKPKENKDWDED
ncbi:T-complex protein 1 subunit theta-like [Tropilaelaps mercedesae]|uniref:T-complex protein 1 subunit theta n=1 Tax=Tropilaelaps mercedesae TaxID=418985 RepID=A0A1V9XVN5_9ACAR|nr:T-complex protein 1 subunit theta-like [Tropilaelaps mercedesae]